MNPGRRERIESFDMIRTVAALAVFTYHFSLTSGSTVFPISFLSLKDGLGFVAVSIFFILSGASLYYTYADTLEFGDSQSLRAYYLKRARAIYPPFYIVFFTLHILRAVKYKNFFYLGKKAVFLLSLAGLDGYFSYETETYYLVGEWFLGALIIIYVLFPLIVYLFRKSAAATFLAVVILYLFMINQRLFFPAPDANIFSCLLSFVAGMMFIHMLRGRSGRSVSGSSDGARENRHISYPVMAAAAVLMLSAVCAADMVFGLNRSITGHLYAAGVFVLLFIFGQWLNVNGPGFMTLFFRSFSRVSYLFFLIHHVILVKIYSRLTVGSGAIWPALWYIILLLIVYWTARILTLAIRYFVNSILFRKRTSI